MSDTTSKLQLPILAADQAQKHVTHNEALLHLDALVQAAVLDRDLSAPPPAPAAGDAYIVAAAASGDWSGREGQLAVWRDNAWYFHQPREGWRVWVRDEDVLLVFDGGVWALATTSLNPADGGMVGINTTATTTSRLSAKSSEVTFDHDGASMQLKLNKAAASDKSHIVLYDNWSGRAEIGLVGDDDLTMKVSPDGSTWHDAFSLVSNFGIIRSEGPDMTVEVGAGKQFANLPEAISYVSTLIPQPGRWINILVDPGTYNVGSVLSIRNLRRVHIKSTDTSNPDATVLQFSADSFGYAHGVIVSYCHECGFSGFKIAGIGANQPRGLLITANSSIWSDDNSIKTANCLTGIVVDQAGRYVGNGADLSVVGAGGHGVLVMSGAFAECRNSSISGDGNTYAGLSAKDGGVLLAANSSVTNAQRGTYGERGGVVYASQATIQSCYTGMEANQGGIITAPESTVTNSGWRGVFAWGRGYVDIQRSTIDGAPDVGCLADQLCFINANDVTMKNTPLGFVSWTMSTIEAWNTNARMVSVTTPYSPSSSGTLGNHNAQIRWS